MDNRWKGKNLLLHKRENREKTFANLLIQILLCLGPDSHPFGTENLRACESEG
jgi:hypothetical protein